MIQNWQNYYQQNKHRAISKVMSDYNKLLREEQEYLNYVTQQRTHTVAGLVFPASTPAIGPDGSGTIVFNGQNPTTTGSFVAARNAQISSWFPSTGSWTVEWFQKMSLGDSGPFPRVWSVGPDTGAVLGVSIEGGNIYQWPDAVNGTLPAYDGTWVHIAMVYDSSVSGGKMRIYAGGSSIGTQNSMNLNLNLSNKDLYIGSDGLSTDDGFAGNITNFRWTNSAVYDVTLSSLTVPTSPLTQLAQTKLLLLGGSTSNPVVDATGTNTLEYLNLVWSSDSPF